MTINTLCWWCYCVHYCVYKDILYIIILICRRYVHSARLHYIRKYNVAYLPYSSVWDTRILSATLFGGGRSVWVLAESICVCTHIRCFVEMQCGVYFTSSCSRKVEVENVEKKYIEKWRDSRVRVERGSKSAMEKRRVKKEGKVYIHIKPFRQKESADREAAYLYNQGGVIPPS